MDLVDQIGLTDMMAEEPQGQPIVTSRHVRNCSSKSRNVETGGRNRFRKQMWEVSGDLNAGGLDLKILN